MTLQMVTVVRREGDTPRTFTFDDKPNLDGSPGRGAAMIASLRNQVRREELHAVTVKPWAEEPPKALVEAAAAKAAPKKATAEA